jgi:hypothetical protein
MPGAPLANLQLDRVAGSSHRMPAFGPFAEAFGSRCDGPLLADSRVPPWPPIAAAERLGSCRVGQLTGAAANSHYRPKADIPIERKRTSSRQIPLPMSYFGSARRDFKPSPTAIFLGNRERGASNRSKEVFSFQDRCTHVACRARSACADFHCRRQRIRARSCLALS